MKNNDKDNLKYYGKNRLVTIIACVLVGAIFFLYLISTKSRIDEYAYYTLESQVKMATMSINAKLNDARRSIVAAGGEVAAGWKEDESFDVVGYVSRIKENYDFDVLEFVDTDGYNLMSGTNRFNASDREYYKEGIKGNTGLWINYEPKESKEYLLDFYSPVYHKGEIVGVLVGGLGSKNSIEPLTKASYFGRESIGVLFNEDYRTIASSLGLEGEVYASDYYEMFNLTALDREIFDSKIANKDGVVYSYEGEKGKGIACVSAIDEYDWGLVIIIPSKTFSSVYADFTNMEIMTLGAIVIVACIYILIILGINGSRYKERLKEHGEIIEGFSKVYHSVFILNYASDTARCLRTRDPAAGKFGITEGGEVSLKENFMEYLLSDTDKTGKETLSPVANVMYIRAMMDNREYFSLEFKELTGGKGSFAMARLETNSDEVSRDRYIVGLTELG